MVELADPPTVATVLAVALENVEALVPTWQQDNQKLENSPYPHMTSFVQTTLDTQSNPR